MAKSRGYSVSVSGNNGHEPIFSYDANKKLWTIDLRPRGPGKNVIHLGDEVVAQLIKARESLHLT